MKLRLGRDFTLGGHIMKEIIPVVSPILAPTDFAMLCFNAGDMHRLTGPHRFYRFPCDDPHYNMKLRLGTGFIFDAFLQLDKLKLLIPLSGTKRGKKSDNPSVLQHVLQNTLKEIIPTVSATLAPVVFATLCFNAGIFRTRCKCAPDFKGFSVYSHYKFALVNFELLGSPQLIHLSVWQVAR